MGLIPSPENAAEIGELVVPKVYERFGMVQRTTSRGSTM